MNEYVTELPPGATVFTDRLAGASLEELVAAARDGRWPARECEAEWLLLRTWAIQTESALIDVAENAAWEAEMRELTEEQLPYEAWVERRLAALALRLRARKLAQARLRDRYGFKRPRSWRLVARDVGTLVESLTFAKSRFAGGG